jgi:hypothetical protein
MKKKFLLGLVAALALSVCSATGPGNVQAASTGPFERFFETFKSAAAARDHVKALAAIRSLIVFFWVESPLVLEKVTFVKGSGSSYGVYEPKGSDLFADGEPIYVYAEPAGYVFKKNPAGYYEFGFKADFQVLDESGKVLGGQNDFAVLPFKSWNPNTEISITFTYTLSGLEKGKYKIVTQVSDMNSPKKASCEKWFTIK